MFKTKGHLGVRMRRTPVPNSLVMATYLAKSSCLSKAYFLRGSPLDPHLERSTRLLSVSETTFVSKRARGIIQTLCMRRLLQVMHSEGKIAAIGPLCWSLGAYAFIWPRGRVTSLPHAVLGTSHRERRTILDFSGCLFLTLA